MRSTDPEVYLMAKREFLEGDVFPKEILKSDYRPQPPPDGRQLGRRHGMGNKAP